MVKIGKLKKEDVENLSNFFSDIFLEIKPHFTESAIDSAIKETSPEFLNKVILMNKWMFLVTKDEDEIVGSIQGYKYGGVFFITWFAVHKDYRKIGLASKLMNALEKRLKEDCHKISLVSATGLKLDKFYEKQGFTKECILENCWWGVNYFQFGKFI